MTARLNREKWAAMPLFEQMANIGSEVGRTANNLANNNLARAESSFERALELFDLTIATGRKGSAGRPALLKEVCRAREVFCGAYLEKDKKTLDFLDKYFSQFALAFRSGK